jgi:hypothetical protein
MLEHSGQLKDQKDQRDQTVVPGTLFRGVTGISGIFCVLYWAREGGEQREASSQVFITGLKGMTVASDTFQ